MGYLRAEPVSAQAQMRRALVVTLLAFLLALIMVFVVWPAQRFVDTRPDPYNYSAIARQMLAEGFGAHGVNKREASLYPSMIAVIYWTLGERPILIKLLQCLMFAATCLVIIDIGRRLYNERTGLVAGFLFAFNPLPLRYVADLHMETMLTFIVTLNAWTMVRFYETRTIRKGLLVGLTAGIAALTKGVALIPPLLFGGYWICCGIVARWRRVPSPGPWSPVVAIALATTLVILPWAARNYHVSGGRFVPLAPGLNDAFLRGYVFSRLEFALLRQPPYTVAENECNAWLAELCRRRGTVVGQDELRDEAIFAAVAKQKIIEEPLELVRKTVVGLFTFWYQMTNLLNSLVAGGIALTAWALASMGWARARREARPNWLLIMPILSTNVLIALLCSLGRYSMPIIPCLMILAAFGVDTLMTRPVPERAAL